MSQLAHWMEVDHNQPLPHSSQVTFPLSATAINTWRTPALKKYKSLEQCDQGNPVSTLRFTNNWTLDTNQIGIYNVGVLHVLIAVVLRGKVT